MDGWITWLLMIAGSYVIGSIPFGVMIGRARGVDIREHGSRNIGATNVGRVLGRPWGILCFFLDLLKGAGPVLVAGVAGGVLGGRPGDLEPTQMWLWLAVAVAAIVGHMASVFLAFAGGKGVATSFGAMLAMWSILTLPALGALVVWYAAVRLTKYVSVASMLSALSLPAWYLLTVIPAAPTEESVAAGLAHASPPLIVTGALALLVLWRHRANIDRLRRGEELRTGGRKA